MTAQPEASPARWELDIPLWQGKPPLTANQRLHWHVASTRKQYVRNSVEWWAKRDLPSLERITARVHYQPSTNRRRDASNLMPTQKAAVDGLVRAGVVPDDTAEYVTELMPVIHPAQRGVEPRLWLEVTSG